MAKKILKNENVKQVLYLFGNEQEFGQALGNLFGLNPDIEVHYNFTTASVRARKQTGLELNAKVEYESVVMAYIVYSNPGDLVFTLPPEPGTDEAGKVKASFKVN